MDASTPDLYADSINLSAGPYGFTLTLLVSEPDAEGSDATSTRLVGRVRVSPELASALADVLRRAVDDHRKHQSATRLEGGRG